MIRVRQQRAVIARIESLGGQTRFDHESAPRQSGEEVVPPGPKVIRMLLGDDVFARVTVVHFLKDEVRDNDLVLVSQLPDTESLYTGGKQVSDQGLVHLGRNRKLRFLCLSNARVTANGLLRSGVGVNLEELSLGGPYVSDEAIAGLEHFPRLTSLQLFRSSVTSEGLRTVSELSGLKRLDLLMSPTIGDDGLRQLQGLNALEEFGLHGTNVSDDGLSHLTAFSRLRHLSLGRTAISDAGMLHVGSLSELSRLILWSTSVGDDGTAHLAQLKKLEHLFLDHTKITDDSMEHLSRLDELRSLRMGGTAVTDNGLMKLRNLSKLEELVVGPNVTRAGAEALKDALPNCRIESFSSTSGQQFILP